MTQLTPELVDQVRRLSADDKGRLIELAFYEYEPGTPEERAALRAELTRRWERLRSGEDVAIPAEEAVAELRRRAEARRTK